MEALAKLDLMIKRKVSIVVKAARNGHSVKYINELYPNDMNIYLVSLGALIRLSNNSRTAERRRPYDEFNHGVVITHRPLKVSYALRASYKTFIDNFIETKALN